MSEIRQWLPPFIQIVTTIVVIVWFFAKLDKRIDLIKQEMSLKFDEIGRDIKEIKDNHLVCLANDIKEIDKKLMEHLINHS